MSGDLPLPIDTDVALRLGEGEEELHEFRELATHQGHALTLSPTVQEQLRRHVASSRRHIAKAAQAITENAALWGLQLFHLDTQAEERRVRQITAHLISRAWLPESERQDARILSECSVAGLPVFVVIDRDFPLTRFNALLGSSMQSIHATPVSLWRPRALARYWLRLGR